MHVDYSYHDGAVARLAVDTIRKIAHVVDLNECLDIDLQFIDVLLDKLFDSSLSEVAH